MHITKVTSLTEETQAQPTLHIFQITFFITLALNPAEIRSPDREALPSINIRSHHDTSHVVCVQQTLSSTVDQMRSREGDMDLAEPSGPEARRSDGEVRPEEGCRQRSCERGRRRLRRGLAGRRGHADGEGRLRRGAGDDDARGLGRRRRTSTVRRATPGRAGRAAPGRRPVEGRPSVRERDGRAGGARHLDKCLFFCLLELTILSYEN
jgi:hypothetical protein